jgi:hypothetical protein
VIEAAKQRRAHQHVEEIVSSRSGRRVARLVLADEGDRRDDAYAAMSVKLVRLLAPVEKVGVETLNRANDLSGFCP